MKLDFAFDNTFARLPAGFFAELDPTPVAEPALVSLNAKLANRLGLDAQALASPEGVAILAGNGVPVGAHPLAQAYAGHQFGGFVPQLGDGRALLLGEVVTPDAQRFDVQLKGSGRTPFSRGGDGRAWLGPVMREYIVSEAMAALGVPTTRALAAVTTGETVLRERPMPGAVLTRVAASHIRVGTFQYFAVRQDLAALKQLTDYVTQRHYPDADGALDLLNAVVGAQARLVAHWMALGFIHGVMNTDNTTISGETIDYGPCAFMDDYHPLKVFSSIDAHGRYAYARQPEVLVWNLAQLASALLPLIDTDQDRAVERATEAVHSFPDIYAAAWLTAFRAKLGLVTAEDGDKELIEGLLTEM
ncbi:MAG: YdiU family protein, partial [Pseudomonadota bacterium]